MTDAIRSAEARSLRASEARLLRVVRAALAPFATDMTNLEGRANDHAEKLAEAEKASKGRDEATGAKLVEHEQADSRRFLQVHTEIGNIHHELEYVKNHLNLVHDQMIEGFRALKVVINKRDPDEVTPPRRKHGR